MHSFQESYVIFFKENILKIKLNGNNKIDGKNKSVTYKPIMLQALRPSHCILYFHITLCVQQQPSPGQSNYLVVQDYK